MASARQAGEEQWCQKRHLAVSRQSIADRQVVEQRVIERRRRVQQRVVDALLGRLRGERGDVLAHQRAVLLARARRARSASARRSRGPRSSTASLKSKSISAGSSTWKMITSLPRKRIRPTASSTSSRLFVEVRNQHDDAAPAEVLGQLVQRRPEPARAARPCARSSVCSTTSRCLADGGTRSTMSSSKVTRPTRSRCLCTR